ncbi:unnamed protein product [Adineta ricciae]|uniref:Uncharacterized protein n=1 Tax=Adineta ricciae TaxID=249248 RepID=A0A815G1Z3_ADIRI|nr:unnamed protein product [Adineta ricciae]
MHLKTLFLWIRAQLLNYNVFIPDDTDSEPNHITQSIKYQLYATRLYVLLLVITLYILFFATLTDQQTRLNTVSNVNSALFDKLRADYDETLSCPCSTNLILYDTFVSNTITFHPICSSYFVSREWIDFLYLSDVFKYFMMDFRATASYQFQLLAALCLFSMQTISQTKTNIASEQFFSVDLLSEQEVQAKIQTNIDLIRSGILTQVNLYFDFLQIFTRSNSFITALNTNTYFADWRTMNDATIIDRLYILYVKYIDLDAPSSSDIVSTCDLINGIVVPSGFLSFAAENGLYDIIYRQYWPTYPPDFEPDISALVDGFFSGCTPLDGILESTFDCLYNLTCLQVLADYFPGLYRVYISYSVLV